MHPCNLPAAQHYSGASLSASPLLVRSLARNATSQRSCLPSCSCDAAVSAGSMPAVASQAPPLLLLSPGSTALCQRVGVIQRQEQQQQKHWEHSSVQHAVLGPARPGQQQQGQQQALWVRQPVPAKDLQQTQQQQQQQEEVKTRQQQHLPASPVTNGKTAVQQPADGAAAVIWQTNGSSRGSSMHTDGSSNRDSNGSSEVSGSSNNRQERFISQCIKQCQSWQQVDAVVREYGPAFNIIHISAAITHLAQLQQRPGHTPGTHTHQRSLQQQQQPLRPGVGLHCNEQQAGVGLQLITRQMAQQHRLLQEQLQQHLGPQPSLTAQLQHNSSSMCSVAQPPPPQQQQQQQLCQRQQLVHCLLEQAAPKLQQAGSRQVANMLWALAVLQQPSSSRMGVGVDLLLQRAAQLFTEAEAQHLSNMALAAAKLQLPVSGVWWQQLTTAWLQLLRQQQLNSTETSNSSSNSMSVDEAADAPVFTADHIGFVGSAWTSSSTQQQLSGAGSSISPHSQIRSVSPHSQSAAVVQGAAEQAAKHDNKLDSSNAALQTPPAMSPQATCNLLWALVQQQQQQQQQFPQQEWLQEVAAATAPQLVSWPAKSVAMFMWGAARLGFRLRSTSQPHAAGPVQQQQQQQQQQGRLQRPHVQAALFGASVNAAPDLQLPSSSQAQHLVASGILAALQQHSQAFTVRDLSQALWAAAVMDLTLPHDLLVTLLTAGSHQQQLAAAVVGPSSAQGRLIHHHQQQQEQQQGVQPSQSVSLRLPATASSRCGPPPSALQHQQQQHPVNIQPSRQAAHSMSVLLWSVSRLCGAGLQSQLSGAVLAPWCRHLSTHTLVADGQSLAVAAWALGRLGLTGACPQLVLRLLTAAAAIVQRQGLVSAGEAAAAGVGSSTPQPDRTSGLPVGAVPALLWAAARCVQEADKHNSQGQQQQQHPSAGTRAWLRLQQQASSASLVSGNGTAAAASADRRPGAGGVRAQQMNVLAAMKGPAATLVLQATAAPSSQQQQEGGAEVLLWQFALIMWSSAVLQLQQPAAWWQGQACQLQLLVQQAGLVDHGDKAAGGEGHCNHHPQKATTQHCYELAQALAVSVWALGRCRVVLPRAHVVQLQHASLQMLQQPQQQPRVLSHQGCVLLLLGFTRLATAAAAHLPGKTRQQRSRQHKAHRLFRKRLLMVQQRQQLVRRRRRHVQQQELGTCQMQPHSQQQQGRVQRRWCWWRRQLQQQRARVVWRHRLWQQQQHGWVTSVGLGAPWLQAYCSYTHPLLYELSVDGVVALLWALGRLRFHPGRAFMAAAQQRVMKLLPSMQPRHIALLMWALARLQHLPEGLPCRRSHMHGRRSWHVPMLQTRSRLAGHTGNCKSCRQCRVDIDPSGFDGTRPSLCNTRRALEAGRDSQMGGH